MLFKANPKKSEIIFIDNEKNLYAGGEGIENYLFRSDKAQDKFDNIFQKISMILPTFTYIHFYLTTVCMWSRLAATFVPIT